MLGHDWKSRAWHWLCRGCGHDYPDGYDEGITDCPASDPTPYWEAAIALIDVWLQYQAKGKLYIDAMQKETRCHVWRIIEKNYNGDVQKLARHRDKLSRGVDNALEAFAEVSARFGVEDVSRDWLYCNLGQSCDYKAIRRKCRKRLKKAKRPESLKNL